MVFSTGHFLEQIETPVSPYVRSKKHWLLATLITQTILCLLTFCVAFDYSSGLYVAIVLLFGWYGYVGVMSQTCLNCWAIMCLITGVLDISFYIEDIVDGTGYFFSTSASVLYNMQSLVEILTSVSLFAGCVLGWHFYMRQGSDMAPGELENAEQPQFGRMFRAREPSHETDQSNFRTFTGAGQRLGE